jgi:predicted transposase YdaD
MSVPAPRPQPASNPHDAYTQNVFRELPQARGFFRGYLPDEVRELFDWRTLRLETGNFLSDQ